jgi:hypothetical protein
VDWTRLRQSRLVRIALTLVVLTLITAGALGAAAQSSDGGRDYLRTPDASNQCDLPLDQRSGGWFCYTP